MKTSTDELLVFVTVIDSGSITKAAEKLEQTVSGVSRALTRLEQKLDTALVRRTTRRLQLTEEGEAFLQRARAILAALEEAEESVTSGRGRPSGRLRVDAASPFMLHCVAPHMKAFSALYPEVRLELTSNERIVDLLEQKVDIAIRIGALQDSTLHARALGTSKLRVLASPAYLAEYGEPKSVEALRAHRLIGFTAPEHLNRWPLREGRKGRRRVVQDRTVDHRVERRNLAATGVVGLGRGLSGRLHDRRRRARRSPRADSRQPAARRATAGERGVLPERVADGARAVFSGIHRGAREALAARFALCVQPALL
ncbi:DNA-binding transcriptional LysR family regulator [Paraburkholderia bryophila]|uniref:DNA-binding transcriptional LysR family regulator n=1 Tax=Paraburkholderia bryophila TaxID=420952 RepID=A0A7Y9WED7_9BURK|nr:DNA-binding transcriptional LysR family regulator [Paraburkholderia bryophila]